MGLAGGPGKGNVFESLRKGGFIDGDTFGMCLHKGSTSNGTFTVGGLDPRLYAGEFAWSKVWLTCIIMCDVCSDDVLHSALGCDIWQNLGGDGLYEMPLTGIAVDGKPVKVARKSAILDSGTVAVF